jgi:hypothetical protein
MIKLLAMEFTLPALQVPVPIKASVEVPPTPPAPPVVVKLPVMLIVFPFSPTLPDAVANVRFVIVTSFGRVVAPPASIAPVGLKVFDPAENVKVVTPSVSNPVILRFDVSVVVNVVPLNVKLFQVKVEVLKVVAAETLSVDPVVTTVPAV